MTPWLQRKGSLPVTRWYELDRSVQWSIGTAVLLLVIASVVMRLFKAARPDKDWQELKNRITTWWVLVLLFVGALVISKLTLIVFLAFVSFLAIKEYLSLIPTRRADRRVLFWAYLTIPVQFLWVYLEWYGMFIIFIPVYAYFVIPFRMITIGHTEGFLRAVGTLHWGLMMTVFSLSHAAFLSVLRLKENPDAQVGPGLLVYLIALTQLNDVAQYIWGKSLGKRKIVPKVSPGKTWAGFLGGVATTMVLSVVAGPLLTPMNHLQSLLAGFIIAIAGFIGDLNMSALKRDLGVKDSSSLLPGHGGVLDRVDSLSYTAPLFFHYVYWMFAFHTHGTAPFAPYE